MGCHHDWENSIRQYFGRSEPANCGSHPQPDDSDHGLGGRGWAVGLQLNHADFSPRSAV